MPDWMGELSHRDWLFDGHPIRSARLMKMWDDLDWTRAWLDMGPSPAGNLGPYWHVPLQNGETVHRLYPKLVHTKWGPLVQHAIEQAVAAARQKVAR